MPSTSGRSATPRRSRRAPAGRSGQREVELRPVVVSTTRASTGVASARRLVGERLERGPSHDDSVSSSPSRLTTTPTTTTTTATAAAAAPSSQPDGRRRRRACRGTAPSTGCRRDAGDGGPDRSGRLTGAIGGLEHRDAGVVGAGGGGGSAGPGASRADGAHRFAACRPPAASPMRATMAVPHDGRRLVGRHVLVGQRPHDAPRRARSAASIGVVAGLADVGASRARGRSPVVRPARLGPVVGVDGRPVARASSSRSRGCEGQEAASMPSR